MTQWVPHKHNNNASPDTGSVPLVLVDYSIDQSLPFTYCCSWGVLRSGRREWAACVCSSTSSSPACQGPPYYTYVSHGTSLLGFDAIGVQEVQVLVPFVSDNLLKDKVRTGLTLPQVKHLTGMIILLNNYKTLIKDRSKIWSSRALFDLPRQNC